MASLAPHDRQTVTAGFARASRRSGPGVAPLAECPVQTTVDHGRCLTMLIEREIIPRLMVAHAAEAHDAAVEGVGPGEIGDGDVTALAGLALQVEADALLGYIDAILARRVPVDTVMVDLLAPAARLLGTWWETDRCDFVDVTMGLWRLQEAVHEIAARAPVERRLAAGGRSALFAAMPGDQHSFGTVVIDEVFRRNGWATERLGDATTSDLLRRAADEWFDLIGLTVSCDGHIATLPSTIAALRNVSRNPRVCVLVGGRIFVADPDLASRVGADGTARDAKLALQLAADLVRVRDGEMLACT